MKAAIYLKKTSPKTFEDWVTKNFGYELFKIFFKTYTEKVWGIDCNKIGAEWAGQRIKNLSISSIVKNILSVKKGRNKIKSLIDEFEYPRKGAGMMYEKLASELKKNGGRLILNSEVISINHADNKIISIITSSNGIKKDWSLDYLVSSMPLTDLIKKLSPLPPKEIMEAAEKLYFRSHITVNLIVKKQNIFRDNWIYIHDPSITMARLTNFNNFSSEMSANGMTLLGCEYFVFKNDKIWNSDDNQLKKFAIEEMIKMNFISENDCIDCFIMREEFAYPTYYVGHEEFLEKIKTYVNEFSNLQVIGRGGMYKYNNQDHSILTGLLAAKNILSGNNKLTNLWEVNTDDDYHEKK